MNNAISLIPAFVIILIGVFFLIKNENTYKQRVKINNALYKYHIDCINEDINIFEVDYYDKESYDSTWIRVFDWGCENILPKEKYELIKRYIK